MSGSGAVGAVLAWLALAGCGETAAMPGGDAGPETPDSGPGVPDAGRPPDLLPSGAMLARPMLPSPPVMTPCPEGWRTVGGDAAGETALCEPWPETGFVGCPAGQVHLPGAVACRALGDPCPSGAFRDDFPAGARVLHVEGGAAAGGDGSRGAPFATIGEAMEAAAPGTVVALAAGEYDEALVVPAGVEITGACAERTRVTSSEAAGAEATVVVAGAGATVRNLSIAGARTGLLIDAVEGVAVRGVAVEGATGCAMRVRGGTATLDDVVLRDVLPDPGDEALRRGLAIEMGARVEAQRVAIERTAPSGVHVTGAGSHLLLADAVIAEGQYRDDIGGGLGMVVDGGGTLEVRRVVLERTHVVGAHVLAGSRLEGSDVLIRDTQGHAFVDEMGRPTGWPGVGIQAEPGGTVRLERARITRAAWVAFGAIGAGSVIELVDAVIEDMMPVGGEYGGAGGCGAGGRARLERVLVRRTLSQALSASGTDARLELHDVAILDTVDDPNPGTGGGGRGLIVLDGASVLFDRVLIDRATRLGIHVIEEGTRVPNRLEGGDLTIRDMQPHDRPGSAFHGVGVAMNLQQGTRFDLERVSVERAIGVALIIVGAAAYPTSGSFRDLRVADTQPAPNSAIGAETHLGRGLWLQYGAELSAERVIFERNMEIGVEVGAGRPPFLQLYDAIVRDTALEALGGGGGHGIWAHSGAEVILDLVRVERNASFGILGQLEGTLIDAFDVQVLGTLGNECDEELCVERPGGVGLAATDGAQVRAERFLVRDSALCGVQVARAGELDLAHGEVAGSPIGANVQIEGYDVARLSNDVRYVDVDRPIDSTFLPLPDPGATELPSPTD